MSSSPSNGTPDDTSNGANGAGAPTHTAARTGRADGDAVHIGFVLDRSGSMKHLVSDVVGGFATFVAEQRQEPGRCSVTVAQFDSQDPFEVLVDDVPVAEVTGLDDRYFARGLTPLYDAIGSMIGRCEERLSARASAGEPADDQLVVIFTDGLENASRRWRQRGIFDRIEEKKAEGWTFVFMGANQDSYAAGGDMGMAAGSISNFSASPIGTRTAFSSASRAMAMYRRKGRPARLADQDDFFGGVKEAEDPDAE
jgi:Mg-chelatase subunit ChlD